MPIFRAEYDCVRSVRVAQKNMTTIQIIGLLGFLLIFGYLAELLFKKTYISDVLLLLAAGYLAGHVFKIIDPAQLAILNSLVSNITLIIILFTAGRGLAATSNLVSGALRAMILSILHPAMCAVAGFGSVTCCIGAP
jgi:NhaP-type Na+/H+ or K+/H+ antiporter